jgi:hypothetical protein
MNAGKGSWAAAEIEAGLRALVRTIAPEGPLPEGASRCVAALQEFLGTRLDAARLAPIELPALTASLLDPWLRQQLVRAMVVTAMADRAPTRDQLERIEAVSAALEVDEPGVVDLRLFIERKRLRLRRHLLGRFWAIERLKARIAERGFFRAVIPAVIATFFRRYRNPALAARFRALRALQEGTLGRAFLAYLDDNHFPLPGERGAVSDIIVQHDLAHVLGGYGTTPAEEVLITAFSTGHRKSDPFAYLLFGIFQFHLGLQVTPGAEPEVNYFDPVRVLGAIRRGAAMRVDLTADWNYWPLMAQPLEAVREDYGVRPRASAA